MNFNNLNLTIELVPSTSFYKNLRKILSKQQWDILRRESYRKANYRCEICGGKGQNHPVECHEIWHYDDENLIQRLNGLISLCPPCHEVKHIGYAGISGNFDRAVIQLSKVNHISTNDAHLYIQKVYDLWEKRSLKQWEIDISWIENKR